VTDLLVGIVIRNDRGEDVLTSHSCDLAPGLFDGLTSATCAVHIEQPWLRPGTYFVETVLQSARQPLDAVRESARLIVEEVSAAQAPRRELKRGAVAPIWRWDIATKNGD
jgi:hypothetical protein